MMTPEEKAELARRASEREAKVRESAGVHLTMGEHRFTIPGDEPLKRLYLNSSSPGGGIRVALAAGGETCLLRLGPCCDSKQWHEFTAEVFTVYCEEPVRISCTFNAATNVGIIYVPAPSAP